MKLIYTSQFKKDYKLIINQGKDLSKLEEVILILMSGQKLETKYKDHSLGGKWKKHRDCHIESDWVLIYKNDQRRINS